MRTKFKFLFLVICFSVQLNAQLDTFNLYEKECGMPLGVYFEQWFRGTIHGKNLFVQKNFTYSYSFELKTHQDSLVFSDERIDTSKYHIMFFNRKNNLLFETDGHLFKQFEGEINFFNDEHKLVRKEFWQREIEIPISDFLKTDGCDSIFQYNYDGSGPVKWIYYRDDGSVRKIKEFTFVEIDCKHNYRRVIVSYYLDRQGDLKKKRTRNAPRHFIWRAF